MGDLAGGALDADRYVLGHQPLRTGVKGRLIRSTSGRLKLVPLGRLDPRGMAPVTARAGRPANEAVSAWQDGPPARPSRSTPVDLTTPFGSWAGWRVERVFRTEKSNLVARPMFHHSDRNSIGHIVACFLALRLEVDLQRRLDERGADVSWPDLMRDLINVQLELDGKRYRLRTDLAGQAHHAFAAAGVCPPPIVTALSPPDADSSADPTGVAV